MNSNDWFFDWLGEEMDEDADDGPVDVLTDHLADSDSGGSDQETVITIKADYEDTRVQAFIDLDPILISELKGVEGRVLVSVDSKALGDLILAYQVKQLPRLMKKVAEEVSD